MLFMLFHKTDHSLHEAYNKVLKGAENRLHIFHYAICFSHMECNQADFSLESNNPVSCPFLKTTFPGVCVGFFDNVHHHMFSASPTGFTPQSHCEDPSVLSFPHCL